MLSAAVPRAASEFTEQRSRQVSQAADALADWAAEQYAEPKEDPQVVLSTIRRLVATKANVDALIEDVLAQRGSFAALPEGEGRREAMRQFLRITSQLIDLSGRLRYQMRDAIDVATYELTPHPAAIDSLIDLLTEERVSIGAAVMTYVLFDPPPESGIRPFPDATKKKVLQLIAAARQGDLLPQLAEFVQQPSLSAELVVTAAYVIRQVGLPQDVAVGQSESLPPPPITARRLREVVSATEATSLSPTLAKSRAETLAWLDERVKRGVTGDVFRCRGVDLRAGDWLLMQNPSPYNMFTDLAPGLFTHVGIVSAIEGDDGIRRFVIVDMPERGARIPAGNVDAYLEQTLYFFFLRHENSDVQRQMGEIAAQLIGNETQFDLTFEIKRVLAEKGKPLKGRRVHTYCAGFLLMCAQETSAPREDFFPVFEKPAGGNTLDNLVKLGLSIGQDFVSPTSAIFSPKLQVVARREPMYSPGREVKQSVYNHFARQMTEGVMTPAPDLFQSLRQTVAGAAKTNPWLARVLASTSNVSVYMDLESAAKAAAVIETLDQIAAATSDDYQTAHMTLLAGPLEQLQAQGATEADLKAVVELRRQHDDLYQRLLRGEVTPRQFRLELVEDYKAEGRRRIDERFFRPMK
ncbi:MAG: hypothetical protein RIC55_08235 [Pirellulaceae bacterium]